jgi:uncharacterized repeat protein (TIGR01451 family)
MKIIEKILDYLKRNKKWVFIMAGSLVIAAGAFLIYYFKFYLTEPNFDDENFNYVYSDTGDNIKPGDRITYAVNYKNTGNRNVSKLVIEVNLPEHTSFVSSDRSDVLNIAGDGKKLGFNIGEVKKNERDTLCFVVEVNSPLDDGTVIMLDKVNFNYIIGKETFNNTLSPVLTTEVESSPDLSSFSVEAVDENGGVIMLGDILKYNLTVKNDGDMSASGVELKSNISEYTDIIEDSITGQGEYKNNSVLWEIDNLEVNTKRVLSFKVRVKEDLMGEEVITSESILKYGSIVIEKKVEEKLSLFSDLATSENYIYDTNGGNLYPGETISVKIIVRNTGIKKEENYSVICPTPEGATYVSRSGIAEGISWSDDIRGLIWDLENLGVEEEKEITFRIKVNENLANSGGTITTHFKIESSNAVIELQPKSLNVTGNARVNIVAIGDSLIAKSNWVQTFDQLLEANYPYAEYNTIASAKNGELTREGYARFDSTVAVHNPDIVIIAYGTNDVGPRYSGFSVSMEGLIVKAKSLGARVFVNLIGPLNWPEKENYAKYNDTIRQIAAKHGAVVIDVTTPLSQNPGGYLSDGMHYSSAGASVVAHTVYSYVSQYLGSIGQRL